MRSCPLRSKYHSRTNLRDFTFKPRVVERLRSASLHTGRPSYSDPSMTKHSDLHTNNKPFCGQELYNPHCRARAKSLELFENSRTLSPNTTSRFGTNNTSSVPTIYYIEDSYSQSGSLTVFPIFHTYRISHGKIMSYIPPLS
ncbi:uncharacterized protein LOC144343166 [Saccoglossus kowalevskii]